MRFPILLTAITIAIGSMLAAQGQEPAPAAAAAPKGNLENGKKIFTSYGCYQCHGFVGQGGGAGPRLAPRPIPYAGFARQLRQPRDQMPPYTAKVVTEQELADIYAYVQSIPAAPAAKSIPILNN